jgi:hypothetical protein
LLDGLLALNWAIAFYAEHARAAREADGITGIARTSSKITMRGPVTINNSQRF